MADSPANYSTDLQEKREEDIDRRVSIIGEHGEIINASGHRDQLKRHYGLLSICGLALTIDNAWVALGGSITVSICRLHAGVEIVGGSSSQLYRQWWTTRCALRVVGSMFLLRPHWGIDR